MKKFVIILLLISLAISAQGADVTLEWDRNKESSVIGYGIHYGFFPETYHKYINADNSTRLTVYELLDGGTYYFAATAYTVDSISDYSNEVSYEVPKSKGWFKVLCGEMSKVTE
jgi:hypothetical protein